MKLKINQEIEALEKTNIERLKHIDKMKQSVSEFASDEKSIPYKYLKRSIALIEDAIAEDKKKITKLQKLLSVKELT